MCATIARVHLHRQSELAGTDALADMPKKSAFEPMRDQAGMHKGLYHRCMFPHVPGQMRFPVGRMCIGACISTHIDDFMGKSSGLIPSIAPLRPQPGID